MSLAGTIFGAYALPVAQQHFATAGTMSVSITRDGAEVTLIEDEACVIFPMSEVDKPVGGRRWDKTQSIIVEFSAGQEWVEQNPALYWSDNFGNAKFQLKNLTGSLAYLNDLSWAVERVEHRSESLCRVALHKPKRKGVFRTAFYNTD